METKECNLCGCTKELSEFRKDKRLKTGRSSVCSMCGSQISSFWRIVYPEKHAARQERYRKRYPNKYKDTQLRHKYNISLDQFNEMLLEQNNKCAICEEEFTELPHVDHDHSCCSGKYSCGKCVRSLLCYTCNNGLGCFKDDTIKLKRAIEYLEKPKRNL
jgi:hypothetical protein